MSKSMSQHLEQFKVGCAKEIRFINAGFSYALREFLIAIPAGIGHIIDSLFLINGMFGKPEEKMHGPFGFIMGLPFAVVGLVVGLILQLVISLPSFIGFLVDRLISLTCNPFLPNFYESMSGKDGSLALNMISGLFTAYVAILPYFMRGPFGFFVGLFPEIVRAIAINILAWPTVFINTITSNISEYISDVDLSDIYLLDAEEENPAVQTKEKPLKIKFHIHTQQNLQNQAVDATLIDELVQKKINLFEIFGITQNDKADKSFRLMSTVFHSDKTQDNFIPMLKQALNAKNSSDTLGSGKSAMKLATFLLLTEIDLKALSKYNFDSLTTEQLAALKAVQEKAIANLTRYKRVLEVPTLRERYVQEMGTFPAVSNYASMTAAMGGGDKGPAAVPQQAPPVVPSTSGDGSARPNARPKIVFKQGAPAPGMK